MILYTKGCIKCDVLKKKLEQKGVLFSIEDENFQKLLDAGIDTIPVLEVDDELMLYNDAIKYVNNL